jgi:hypothetical protein
VWYIFSKQSEQNIFNEHCSLDKIPTVEELSDVKDAYKNRHSDKKKYLGALCMI